MITSHPGLTYCTSSNLPIPHGMFCRHGGVGSGPFNSLNLSYSVGDSEEAVKANRNILRQRLRIEHLCSAHQIHSDVVAVIRSKNNLKEIEGADALITSMKGIGLLIQQADCQAVLLYDPQQQAIGAIHCGWKGSVINIIATTVAQMQKEFAVAPHDLRAVISPSLGPCCAEFQNYRQELPTWMHAYQVRRNYFDFWAITRQQLRQAGIKNTNIETTEVCTKCNDRFFSYRRSTAKGEKYTGRNGSVISLPQTDHD
ncbi:peptidoglycan editing factor PgeF [Desulfogranum marinum]|uniref:peptidoglycan editing factor PgeF n=1 Tax=Desulfogranum marinum TaxID=453220 RepID=UPI0029C6F7E9|nr:peptidoglycan editing factor PgeF [Desulfogranum marinum]